MVNFRFQYLMRIKMDCNHNVVDSCDSALATPMIKQLWTLHFQRNPPRFGMVSLHLAFRCCVKLKIATTVPLNIIIRERATKKLITVAASRETFSICSNIYQNLDVTFPWIPQLSVINFFLPSSFSSQAMLMPVAFVS